jgi:hypothetical protein
MKRTKILLFGLAILCFSAIAATAQTSNIVKKDLSQADIDRIVRTFTSKEKESREALAGYVFYRNATIQTLGMGGQVSGLFRRDSFLALTPEGARFEKILFAPVPTTPPGFITPEDLEDLSGVNPFALDPTAVPLYNFTYVGAEKIDELDLYVFDVSPKVMPDAKKTKQRFFTGRIWVDQQDLQIVKTKGKGIPETKNNKFPVVETWRENVSGKYWFPSYSSSDDELVFDSGESIRLKIRITYKGYTVGKSDVRILDEGEETPEEKPKPTPAPTPKKP